MRFHANRFRPLGFGFATAPTFAFSFGGARMYRVTAGESFSFTYDVSSSGEAYTARVLDPLGREMDATVTESSPNVTVAVDYQQWRDGQSGWGRLEIRREDTKAIVKRDRFRVMGGIRADDMLVDYGVRS